MRCWICPMPSLPMLCKRYDKFGAVPICYIIPYCITVTIIFGNSFVTNGVLLKKWSHLRQSNDDKFEVDPKQRQLWWSNGVIDGKNILTLISRQSATSFSCKTARKSLSHSLNWLYQRGDQKFFTVAIKVIGPSKTWYWIIQ